MTSAICQEFGCRPSEADEEDFAACFEIMALRRYAEAWRAVEDGMKQEDLKKQFGDSESLKNVLRVQIARMKGEID